MGEAKRRGTFEERKAKAIVEGRDKSLAWNQKFDLRMRPEEALALVFMMAAQKGLEKEQSKKCLTLAEEEAIRNLKLA